jgi:arylsulfatase A-like enzyme
MHQRLPRRDFLKAAGFGAAALSMQTSCAQPKPQAQRKPNILFILVDDLGKEWVNCCGSEWGVTPNVDKLAQGGIRFTNCYSMPQCTPTRATLLTGQYPFRHGWINHWDVPRWGAGCHFDPKHNASYAKQLKDAGYATAIAGKWQINDFRVQPKVLNELGFDDYCMWTGWEADNPPSAERYWDPYIHTKKGSKTYAGQFGEDIFTDFLIDFMKQHKDEPMLMYYPMALPHGPLTPTPDEPNVTGKEETHLAMVRYVDKMAGKLTQALDDLGLREDTIIIWTTDNGTSGGLTARLDGRMVKGGKGRPTENGVWEPFIVNCPGRVPAGVVSDCLTDFSDIMPTFVELAGAELPQGHVVDGKSIAKVILGEEEDGSRDWIMAMGGGEGRVDENGRVMPIYEYRDRVIRDKRYKLFIDTNRQNEKLVDLLKDPAEEVNLLDSTKPRVMAALKKFTAVAATFPEKDAGPRYDPNPPQPWDIPAGTMPSDLKKRK